MWYKLYKKNYKESKKITGGSLTASWDTDDFEEFQYIPLRVYMFTFIILTDQNRSRIPASEFLWRISYIYMNIFFEWQIFMTLRQIFGFYLREQLNDVTIPLNTFKMEIKN